MFYNKVQLMDIQGERSKELYSNRIGLIGSLDFCNFWGDSDEAFIFDYANDGNVLRSSPIKNTTKQNNQLTVTTKNTVYVFNIIEE